jgi:hypothetical protein
MNSKLLAFNVAQDLPVSANDAAEAYYDAKEQVLVGANSHDYKAYASSSLSHNGRRANIDGYIQDGYDRSDMS